MALNVKNARFLRLLAQLTRLVVIITLGAIVISVTYITFFLSDSIKARTLALISRSLSTEVSLSDIELDLYNNFPYISITIHDVRCKENFVGKPPQNLFTAKKVNLLLSLWDLIMGDISLKKIILQDGAFNFFRTEHNKPNWTVISTNRPRNEEAAKSLLSLNRIHIKNMIVNFRDEYFNNNGDFKINNLEIIGNLLSEKPDLILESDFALDSLKLSSGLLLKEGNYYMITGLEADSEKKSYLLKTCELRSDNGISIKSSGELHARSTGEFYTRFHGTLKASQLNFLDNYFKMSTSLWPESLKLSGNVEAEATLEGHLSQGHWPALEVKFKLQEGRLYNEIDRNTEIFILGKGSILIDEIKKILELNLACASQSGTQIKSALKFERTEDKDRMNIRFNGKISLPDLYTILSSKKHNSSKISGLLEGQAAIFFNNNKNKKSILTTGNLYGQHIIFVLDEGKDSIITSELNVKLNNQNISVTVKDGALFGNSFSMSANVSLDQMISEPTDTKWIIHSNISFPLLNISQWDKNLFTETILFNDFTLNDLLKTNWCNLHVEASKLVYKDFYLENADLSICSPGQGIYSIRLNGDICQGRLDALFIVDNTDKKLPEFYSKGQFLNVQGICWNTSLKSILPKLQFTDVSTMMSKIYFEISGPMGGFSSPKLKWTINLNGGSGQITGSMIQEKVAQITGIPELKKIIFTNLTYESWGDSSQTTAARGEIKGRAQEFKWIKTNDAISIWFETSETLPARPKMPPINLEEFFSNEGLSINRLIFKIDSGNKLENLTASKFRDDFSTWKVPKIFPFDHNLKILKSENECINDNLIYSRNKK